MAAGNTYVAIATNTLSSTTQTVTFSSIPATYTDLILIMSPANSSGSTVRMQLNGDTGNNYSDTYLKGNGTTAASLRNSNQPQLTLGDDADPTSTLGESVFVVQIMNYANTTTYKTVLTRANIASADVEAVVGLWRSTSAVNQIDVKQGGAVTFSVGSTFSLYGILAA